MKLEAKKSRQDSDRAGKNGTTLELPLEPVQQKVRGCCNSGCDGDLHEQLP